jgi:hypothetical protein
MNLVLIHQGYGAQTDVLPRHDILVNFAQYCLIHLKQEFHNNINNHGRNIKNPRPQQVACPTCKNLHTPGRCWVENNVICGNCDGQHPTDRCRRPDRVKEMQPPVGDYPRQAKENLQGMRRNELKQTSEPPNFYYNQRQPHASPTTLQTSRGTLPLQNTLSSQDVRMAEAQIPQGSNLQTNYVEVAPTK